MYAKKQNKKITVIIQARLDSTRLPKKVSKKIQNKPMIWHVINRIKKTHGVEQIILATSDDPSDIPLLKIAKKENIIAFAGNKKNVLNRYFECAKEFSADPIIRITGDCPLIDFSIVERMLKKFLKNDYDYMTNTNPPTFPDGLDVEIFSFKSIEKAHKLAKLKSEKEHVTPYILKNLKKFKIYNFSNKTNLSHFRWTVDEIDDLKLIRKIFAQLKSKKNFLTEDFLKLFEKNPDVLKINSHISRNEGYLLSLKND